MKEKNYKNMNFTQKESSYYEFYDRGKVDVMDFWEQKKSFSTQEVGRKMIFT